MEWLKKQNLSTKKKLLFTLFIALVMEFFLGVVLVNAQSGSDVLLPYSVTPSCEISVQFPFALTDNYISKYGTVSSQIQLHDDLHPTLSTTYSLSGHSTLNIGNFLSTILQFGALSESFDWDSVSNIVTTDADDWNIIGDQYFWWSFPDGDTFYISFSRAGANDCSAVNSPDFGTVNPLDFNTRLVTGTATGTASTSISVDVDYFLDTSEFSAISRPDAISVISQSDIYGQSSNDRRLILPLADGSFSKNIPMEFSDTGGFPDGDYYAYVNFYNINTDGFVFSNSTLIIYFVVTGGAISSSSVEYVADGLDISTSFEYQDCSITNIYGCFVNAFIFTLVPADDAFNKFTNLWTLIEQKPPFGYVTSLIDALNGNGLTTPAFDFGALPFVGTIFDPFKLLLAIGLWFIYSLYFLGRMDKLDI